MTMRTPLLMAGLLLATLPSVVSSQAAPRRTTRRPTPAPAPAAAARRDTVVISRKDTLVVIRRDTVVISRVDTVVMRAEPSRPMPRTVPAPSGAVPAAPTGGTTVPTPRADGGGWHYGVHVGAFVPTLPLVSIPDGAFASVNQTSAPSVQVELDRRLRAGVRFFLGTTFTVPQVTSSGVLQLGQNPSRPVYAATTFLTTAGLQLNLPFPVVLGRPSLRLGGGFKSRFVDMPQANNSYDLAADVGLGWRIALGPAEAVVSWRFAPSQFNPATLPIVLGGTAKQQQNDHILSLGLRWAR